MFSVKLVVRVQYQANFVKYFVLTFCKMYFRRSREGRPLSIVIVLRNLCLLRHSGNVTMGYEIQINVLLFPRYRLPSRIPTI